MSDPSGKTQGSHEQGRARVGRVRVPFRLGVRGKSLLAGSVVVLIGVGAWMTHTDATERRMRLAAASAAAASRQSATGPAAACEAERRRLLSGGDPLSFDPTGWVVEMWFARDANWNPLAREPALLETDGESLPSRVGAAMPAQMTRVDEPASGRVVLRYDGGYVRAFMQADGRARFVTLVDELAQAAGVEHAALYARCAHSSAHDVGAYFRGRDPAGAAAALLYAQGMFVSPQSTVKAVAHDDAASLATVEEQTRALELPALEEIVRDHGGRVVLPAGAGTTGAVGIAFPVDAPLRAQQAARALGVPRTAP